MKSEKAALLEKLFEKWEKETLAKSLKGTPERESKFETTSGIELKRVFNPLDLGGFDYSGKLGFPGIFPFTRGIQPTMYRGRLWTMRQYAGFGTAEQSNQRYRYLLDHGQTGLSVAFDLPTQMGYDSDHPVAEGEVGKVGVAIDSIEDMDTLLKDIPLDRVSTSMTINSTASIILAMYVAVSDERGGSRKELKGTVQNDILKEYIARGTYIFPPEPSMRLVTDLISFCAGELPLWNTISISGYHIREAGATAVQEVAFTLANACTYVESMQKAGLAVDDFAPRLSFFFNVHSNFLEEVAKFRAARRLWAGIMKGRFKAKDPRSLMLRFHAQTAGCSLTQQQPENNAVRVALQALAAVLGGAQSLHTNSRDEALALPSEESVKLALRTQQIIAHETGVADTVDPLGGSYALERITDEIEEQALKLLKDVEDQGGVIASIRSGMIEKAIHESAYRHQKLIEQEKRIIVGVNRYVEPRTGEEIKLLRVNPEVENDQKKRLKKLKETRDNNKVSETLAALRKKAASGENLISFILACVKVKATIGEISDSLRSVFGVHSENRKI